MEVVNKNMPDCRSRKCGIKALVTNSGSDRSACALSRRTVVDQVQEVRAFLRKAALRGPLAHP